MKELANNQLEVIVGGGKNLGDAYVSFMGGAAQGVIFCFDTGIAINPMYVLGCAGVGGVLGVMFPS